jgi:hypothetical protein
VGVGVYVCMYVDMYLCICMYIYIYMHVYIYKYIYVYTHGKMYTFMSKRACARINVRMTYAQRREHVCMHVCIRTDAGTRRR